MKITFEGTKRSKYIELLPSMAYSWYDHKQIHIGWLLWSLFIEIK